MFKFLKIFSKPKPVPVVPPCDGRFVMLKLDTGRELVGWHDKKVPTYYIRWSMKIWPYLKIIGWRELTCEEKQRENLE